MYVASAFPVPQWAERVWEAQPADYLSCVIEGDQKIPVHLKFHEYRLKKTVNTMYVYSTVFSILSKTAYYKQQNN